MKVFISWSGKVSHGIALVLREWLPCVIQSLEPYVSSEDIDKGTRWSTDISSELETSSFGILCVTKENLNAPWLVFEAGALSKTVDKSRVCPFLFGVKKAEVNGPILQFQSTIYEENDVKKLVQSLNKACNDTALEDTRLDKIFSVLWPKLKNELDTIFTKLPANEIEEKTNSDSSLNSKMLEEILELTRNQQKMLSSPETWLPLRYIANISANNRDKIPPKIYRDLEKSWFKLKTLVAEINKNNCASSSPIIIEAIKELTKPIEYILAETNFPLFDNKFIKEILLKESNFFNKEINKI